MNSFDPVLLHIFAAEQQELLQSMRAAVHQLSGGDVALFETLLHRAHTLKGAARAVGLDATETLMHLFETVALRLRGRAEAVSAEESRTLQASLDYVEDVLAWALDQRGQPDEKAMLSRLHALLGDAGGELPSTLIGQVPDAPADAPASDTAPTQVRVGTNLLDAVASLSTQLVIGVGDYSRGVARCEQYAETTAETIREYERLRRAAAGVIARHRDDPSLTPLLNCVRFLDDHRAALLSGARTVAESQRQSMWKLERQIEELRENVDRAQMIPAESVFGAFGAMVRAFSESENKPLEYQTEGLDVRATRQILQALKEPVMHLLRNAVSHGIEPAAVRAETNKSPIGKVTLRVTAQGNQLHVFIQDDGAGIDGKLVVQEAERRGLLEPSAARELHPEDQLQLIFLPGISTLGAASTLAGRGLGLAIVKEAVHRLHGQIRIESHAGAGTVFHIAAPLTASTQQVLLLKEGAYLLAVPLNQVEAVIRREVDSLLTVNDQECLDWEGRTIRVLALPDVLTLGGDRPSAPDDRLEFLIVKDGPRRVALSTRQILEVRETIVRDPALDDAHRGWSRGAIPLEDGRVAVLVDLVEPLRRFSPATDGPRLARPRESARHRILVVDDSITTRSVERNILEAQNYQVELAVDGLDGWERVQRHPPDLVISDVAMPRMTGLELLEKIKNNPATRDLPVILVTSLEAAEDQQRGLSLGADAYLVKRKFDQRELLATIRQIL